MSTTNPYQTPTSIDEEPAVGDSAVGVSPGASWMWLAATVALITAGVSHYVMSRLYGWKDPSVLSVRALLLAAALTIPAVAAYALVRNLGRSRFRYASTPASLITAGAIIAVVLSGIYFPAMLGDELLGWFVMLVLAPAVCYAACWIERLVAGANQGGNEHSSDSAAVVPGASVFWFSSGCLVFGFLGSAIVTGIVSASAQWMTIVITGAAMAAILCVVGTFAYGLVDALIRRRHPATSISRLIAALVFTLCVILFAQWMEVSGAPPGFYRLLIVVPVAPVCVLVERLIASGSSTETIAN